MPFSHIMGQEKAKKFLRQVLAMQRVPHAYLFCGISGVGKKSMAKAIAMALNCDHSVDGDGCGVCPSCRAIADGNSPDFLLVGYENRETFDERSDRILIEHIRKLNHAVGFSPIGRYRVCVLDHAQNMTVEAANSFLKILEEPPPGNIFILNAVDPLDLLPTIVSRCQRVAFQPLSINNIKKWLFRERDVDEESADILSRVCSGSLGKAIDMFDGNYLVKRKSWLSSVVDLFSVSRNRAFLIAVEYMNILKDSYRTGSGGRNDVFDMFMTWKSLYRDLILIKEGAPFNMLMNMDYIHDLERHAQAFDVDALLKSIDLLNRTEQDLMNNINMSLIMEQTVMGLWSLVRGG